MKKIIIIVTLLFIILNAQAQTFSWAGYVGIRDNRTDTVTVNVNGLPAVIDTNFGVAHICFNITHTYKADLIITLVSPDGSSVVLVQNVGGQGDNFTGTCVGMDGTTFSNSTAPFTGIFVPQGDVSALNNGQNPNGNWLFIVRDMATGDTGSVHNVSIAFTNNPPRPAGSGGVTVPTGTYVCATCVCPGGAAGCDLLPDMTASAKEIILHHSETPGFLYISNATPNIGYGPIEVYGSDSCFCGNTHVPCNTICPNGEDIQHVVKQRVYQKVPGTDSLTFYDRVAGRMTYHAEHGHIHVDHWSNYTLRTATSNPDATTWPIVGTGVKQSFCLINLGTCAGNPGECRGNNGDTVLTAPNNNLGFHTGCGLTQGIYPGNYDVYSLSLNDPIPLVNVCNGNYYIVSITDPENNFLESDETNNWVAVPITLTQQNQAPNITASGSTTFCDGGSVTLTASIGNNYHWSTGDTTRSIVVNTGGSFTVSTSCDGVSPVFSTPVTTTVIPSSVPAQVSIALSAGSMPSCAGNTLVFTATPVNGGSSPIYQWKVNGNTVGTNSATFTTSGLSDGDVVSCVLTSGISCLAATPANSNTIPVTIKPTGNPKVELIQTAGTNPQCLNTPASFIANVENGYNISYQWKLNGGNVGTNVNTYSNPALVNGDWITCEVNATPVCPIKTTVGLSTVTNTISNDAGVAYPTYYGNGRQQYLVLASELTALGLTAGNISSLGFSLGSATGNPATLNGYSIKIAPTTANALTTVFSTPIFTTVFGPLNYTPLINSINTHPFSTPFNWDGTSNLLVDICFSNQVVGRVAYQNYQVTTPFISSIYYQADSVSGSGACVRTTGNTTTKRPVMIFTKGGQVLVTSNKITMSVNSATTPSVAAIFTTGAAIQCPNTVTTFKAVPNNTGAAPTYQWVKNGSNIAGAVSSTYITDSLHNYDTIYCIQTSGAACGDPVTISVSNKIGITIVEPMYTFIGDGNWDVKSNWSNSIIPPAYLLNCSEIFVDPMPGGECYLNVIQTIAPGAKITVMPGKKLRMPGNLRIQ